MTNPRRVPSCVYRHPRELVAEARRNRGRFRRHIKPHLHTILCWCCRPWEPQDFNYGHCQRALWMRVHALALLDALAPLGAALVGTLALQWGDPDERYPGESMRHADVIALTLATRDWPAAAAALRSLDYRVIRASGALGLDAEGHFDVSVRAASDGAPSLDAAALRARMLAYYNRPEMLPRMGVTADATPPPTR